jgi:hypothetical protein
LAPAHCLGHHIRNHLLHAGLAHAVSAMLSLGQNSARAKADRRHLANTYHYFLIIILFLKFTSLG